MAQFQYRAIDADGQERTGALEAANEATARALLQKRSLMPVQIEAGAFKQRRVAAASAPTGRAKLSHKNLLLMTRQLATLIDASVQVDEALAMIAAQQESAAARAILNEVKAGVLEGRRLADALALHPASFSALYRAAVAGGERAGRLGLVLMRLAEYLGRAHAMRTKVQTAMIYPAALSLVALTVVTCLMIFVVPSLTEQFERFDQTLPLLTQVLIAVSGFLTQFWPLLLIAMAAGALVLRALLGREPVRLSVDAFLLRAPVAGRWAKAVSASRFVRAVSTLVSSGMPVLESVRAARESVGNRAVALAVAQMAVRIEEGEPLSAAMRRSDVIPPMVCYMTQSGENAGELAVMLDKAADHLDQEFEAFTASALSLLEPAIIVLMGLIVASIVLAIMLPILQLNRLAIG